MKPAAAMYEAFYDLREPPFELTPDPRYLYLPPRHLEALSNVQYGLSTAKAVTVLTGEAGTGKTTLLRAALESPRCRDVRALHVTNPTLSRDEFVQMLARGFNLSPAAERSKVVLLDELDSLLRERRSRGELTALIIDEAQGLSDELLEETRLLANIERATEKLLPLVLVGQPELADRLEQPSLRQLKQRVSLRCELGPFSLAETASYLTKRIDTAGGIAERLFTREAVMMIHDRSAGIPRTINVICDNALITGMALGLQPVDESVILHVAADFRLDGQAPPGPRAHEKPAGDRTATAAADPDDPADEALIRSQRPPSSGPRRLFALFSTGRR